MFSVCTIAGYIETEPVIDRVAAGITDAWMKLRIDRAFRNYDGTLSYDVLKVKLWRGIAEECAAACRKGDFVILQGRIESEMKDDESVPLIIAEKVSYPRSTVRAN